MNNGKIVLSGGGDLDISFQIDKKYFSLLKNNSKILYIPIALRRNALGYENCYDWFSSVISAHSEGKDIDFTMLLEKDDIPTLDSYDSIYVGGGNTFWLLNYFLSHDLKKKISQFINNGGVYYGGSAGAMILGKDIRTVIEENDNNYSSFKGLNILKNYSIYCHYLQSSDEKIFTTSKIINSKIIALPENSGIIMNCKGTIIDSVGKVYIFDENSKKEI